MCTILIADDDNAMLNMVEQILDNEGYDVLVAHTVDEVWNHVNIVIPDLFLLDLAFADSDGIKLCRRLRNHASTMDRPIIFLTSDHNAYSVAEALGAGGDDYIRKPFAVRELTARIRAHLRWTSPLPDFHTPMIKINENTYQVFVNQREVSLTRIEFELLKFMSHEPGQWFATQDLLGGVWNYPNGVGDTALVRNHIRNLRRKLEINPDYPSIIQSRHGRGYAVRAQIQFMEQSA